jgi:hypothetical protein
MCKVASEGLTAVRDVKRSQTHFIILQLAQSVGYSDWLQDARPQSPLPAAQNCFFFLSAMSTVTQLVTLFETAPSDA